MVALRPKHRASPAKKVSDAVLRRSIIKHDGMLSMVARAVGLTRQSVHYRVNSNPEFQELMAGFRTEIVDLAESVMYHRMDKFKDREAAKFVLQNLGKSRGYGPQPEIAPPPPDNSRRQVVIQNIVMMLGDRAAAVHAQPVDITPAGALNGHAKPVPKPNGHIVGSAAAQLIAAKKGNGKV